MTVLNTPFARKQKHTPGLWPALATVALGLLHSQAGHAYALAEGPCGGDSLWPSGAEQVKFGARPDGTWTFSQATDDEKAQIHGHGAISNAINSYKKYSGVARWHLYHSGTFNAAGSGWFDNGNEESQMWFETEATLGGFGRGCTSSSLACSGDDHVDLCVPFGGDSEKLATDTAIAIDRPWEVVKQDSVQNCFRRSGASVENTALHELGHHIGLAHQESTTSVMNTERTGHHACSSAANNYRDAPRADDVMGYMHHYASYSSTPRNWHGSPWTRSSTGSSFATRHLFFGNSGESATTEFKVDLESDFPHTGVTAQVWLMWIPEGQEPTKNSNNTWNMATPQAARVLPVVNAGVHTQTYFMDVHAWFFSLGIFRLWVVIDPNNLQPELDEDDNAFPTDVMVARLG